MAKDIDGVLYLTISQAAQELGLSKATLLSYVRQGRLKSERIGRAELIPVQTLQSYRAKRS